MCGNFGSVSDEVLYTASHDGDRSAFQALVHRHSRMVQRLAFNILGEQQAAEDAMQEVFLALWRQDRWSPGDARFTTWLGRVAINKAIDHRRRRAPITVGDETMRAIVEAEVSLSAQPEQEARLVERDRAVQLRHAMAKLPSLQRQALALFYFDDLDVLEIAAAMNSTELAVRSLLKRGRQGLKTSLQKQKKICDHGRPNIEGGS